MIILGIESSCDETAIAIVDDAKRLYSHKISSQIDSHRSYGGVVPELASRNHLDAISFLCEETIKESGLNIKEIDAIAVTSGPGLIGGLLVGVMFAKGLSVASKKPLISVNHLEAHALMARFTEEIEFPYNMLLVSGGHCQILEVRDVSDYTLLGATMDDSIGEAFDKVAKMMGLPYPGGPQIEQLARLGDANKYQFKFNTKNYGKFDFSFSGIKSACKRLVDDNICTDEFKQDLAASFQRSVTEILCNRIRNVYSTNDEKLPLVVAGGVAANQYIIEKLRDVVQNAGATVHAPPPKLCVDNGIMVAWAGLERFRKNMVNDINFEPRSRWPLEELKV